jgi:hypothetical protein
VTKLQRQPLYERGYRKTKEAMFVSTELANRDGFLGLVGRVTYLAIWAGMLTVICIIWLLTLGGKLIKQTTEIRSHHDGRNQEHPGNCHCNRCGKTTHSN